MSDLYKVTNPLVTQEDIDNHIGIGLVLKDKDGLIAVFWHAKYQFWTIPIGKAKLSELPVLITRKEAREELGIEVNAVETLGTFNKNYDRGNGIVTHIQTIIYEITGYHGEPHNKEPEKHPIMNWTSLENLASESKLSDATVFYLGLQKVLDRECIRI